MENSSRRPLFTGADQIETFSHLTGRSSKSGSNMVGASHYFTRWRTVHKIRPRIQWLTFVVSVFRPKSSGYAAKNADVNVMGIIGGAELLCEVQSNLSQNLAGGHLCKV